MNINKNSITKTIVAAGIAAATPIISAGIGAMVERHHRYSASVIADTTINCGKKRFYGKRFVNCTLYNVQVLDKRTFESCIFEKCRFENTQPTNCAFNECVFHNCTFTNVLFVKCAMNKCTFDGCEIIACDYDRGRMNAVKFINCETAGCSCGGSVVTNYVFENCRHHMWRNISHVVVDGQVYETVIVPSEKDECCHECNDNILKSTEGWGVTKDDIRPMGYSNADDEEDNLKW